MRWNEKLVYLPNASDNRRSWILATLMLSSSLHEGSAWQRIHRLHRRHPFLRVPHGRHSRMDYLHTQEQTRLLACSASTITSSSRLHISFLRASTQIFSPNIAYDPPLIVRPNQNCSEPIRGSVAKE